MRVNATRVDCESNVLQNAYDSPPSCTSVATGYLCEAGPCAIVVGDFHTCYYSADTSGVHCFGEGGQGQLGYQSTAIVGRDPSTMPPPQVDVGEAVLRISAGGDHTCVITVLNTVRCWGRGFEGQLGYENQENVGHADNTMPPADVNLGGTVRQVGHLN